MFKPSFEINRDDLIARDKGQKGTIRAMISELSYIHYPSKQARRIIIFYHGGGANNIDYTKMAFDLALTGNCHVFLFDIRGHGSSGGARGYASTKELIWEDVNSAITFVRSTYPDLPIYLGGHSSGSGLILNYSKWHKKKDVSGYIMIAPELGPKIAPQRTNFAKANKLIFFINRLSNGTFFNSALAVKFNYSQEQIEDLGCLPGYTVAMSDAVTPNDPINALLAIDKPLHIVIASDDEVIDNAKLIPILENIQRKNINLTFTIAQNEMHIMILKNSGAYIADFFRSII